MEPQCHLGIYIEFDFPSIIRYLEPQTGDAFKTRLEFYEFDESHFPALSNDLLKLDAKHNLSWTIPGLSH